MPKIRNKHIHCLNCNYQFKESENYCPNCGQENHDLKIPFRHFLEESLEGIFHFDNKIWVSIKTIFLYPGRITKDYLEGKRVRFVPPIRLYIFFSFIFFLVLNINSEKNSQIKENEKFLDALEKDSTIQLNGLDSLKISLDEDTAASNKEKNIFDRINNMKGSDIRQLNQKIYKYFSFSLFFLLPLFALIMKLVYYRSGKYYYEHFIAAIHYHVILFIAMTIAILLTWLGCSKWIYLAMLIAVLIYFVYSLKVVYGGSWMKNSLKAFLIFFHYGFVLLIVLTGLTLYIGYQYMAI